MAIPATAVFECRSSGDDLNAGGFDPTGASPGTDYTLQDAAHLTIDGATVTATVHTTTTQITIVGATVDATYNRNSLRISGGTATAGLYFITAVDTVNNRLTLDRSAGTSTQTVQGRIGGAVKFFGTLTNSTGTTLVPGNVIWIKSGTYTLTTTTPGPGGPGEFITKESRIKIEGYETTRGDMGEPPLFHAGSLTSFNFLGFILYLCVRNLKFDCNNQTAVIGINGGAGTTLSQVDFCIVINSPSSGFAQCRVKNSYAENCLTGFNTCGTENCGAYNCGNGFSLVSNKAINCWVAYCTSTGFFASSGGCIFVNCVSYGNTGSLTCHGFAWSTSGSVTFINCVAVNNQRKGFDTSITASNSVFLRMLNCATYGNGEGVINTCIPIIYENTELTADPFVDGTALNFSLNNTVGAGAALRGNSSDPYAQSSNADIGAVQHQDSFTGTTLGGWS